MDQKLQKKIKMVRQYVTIFRGISVVQFIMSILFSLVNKSVMVGMIVLAFLQMRLAYNGPQKMGMKNNDSVLGVKGTESYKEGRATIVWSVRMIIIAFVVAAINNGIYLNRISENLMVPFILMTTILPFIGIILLIIGIIECKLSLMTDHRSTTKLKDIDSKSILKENITYLINESGLSTESIEKVTKDGKYILEYEDFKLLYQEKADEYANKTFHKCYLVELRDQNALQRRMDRAYEDYKQSTDGILHTITLVNYRARHTKEVHVPKEYENSQVLNYVEIQDISELNFDLIRKENTRGKKYSYEEDGFYKTRYYFQQVNAFTEALGLKPENKNNSDIISQFYDDARLFQNPLRSVMALLDYEEMILRLISLYYFVNPEATVEMKRNRLLQGNFLTMGKFIGECAVIDEERKARLDRVYDIPELMKYYIEKLWLYAYITFEGDKINFYGLLSLTLAIRNKLVAHGTLNKDGEYLAWGVMFYATALLNEYLDIDHFKLVLQETGYRFGYETKTESLIDVDKLIIESDGKPCFANTAATGREKLNYINYFNGDLIVPNFEI